MEYLAKAQVLKMSIDDSLARIIGTQVLETHSTPSCHPHNVVKLTNMINIQWCQDYDEESHEHGSQFELRTM